MNVNAEKKRLLSDLEPGMINPKHPKRRCKQVNYFEGNLQYEKTKDNDSDFFIDDTSSVGSLSTIYTQDGIRLVIPWVTL